VLLLLIALLAVGLFALSARTHGSASVFWLTLATGMIATAVFSACSVLLTTQQFDNFLRGTIEQSVEQHLSAATQQLLAVIQDRRATFTPLETYPATNHPDEIFNRDLNRSFMTSGQYSFQGVTARYAIARLSILPVEFDHIKIVVADPTRPDSVVERARHMDDGRGRTDPQRRSDLIDEIWMSIVGAHLARRKADRIEFCLLADPPVNRAEIFDNDIFVTRFSDPDSKGFEFPASCRFPKNSMPYQTCSKDVSWLFTSPYTVRFEIPRTDDPASLLAALEAVGIMLTGADYERLANEFLQFRGTLPATVTPSG
jgi:hypothetical protein